MKPAARCLAFAPELLVALVLGLGQVAATHAQDMGRLFLTPEQRAALEARRRARVPDVPDKPGAVILPVTRIDGYVQRQGGKSTVWVNGEPRAEGSRPGARIRPARTGAASVSVPVGEESRDVAARAGQSIDSITGEVRDPLGDGEIKVSRPAPPKPAARPGQTR